jgi:hypothetical protein
VKEKQFSALTVTSGPVLLYAQSTRNASAFGEELIVALKRKITQVDTLPRPCRYEIQDVWGEDAKVEEARRG